MKVIRNHNHRVFLVKKHPMGKNYLAICLFGFVLSIRPLDAEELKHELIHAARRGSCCIFRSSSGMASNGLLCISSIKTGCRPMPISGLRRRPIVIKAT